jgi:hypothetical protein
MSDMINENQPIAPAPPEPEAPARGRLDGAFAGGVAGGAGAVAAARAARGVVAADPAAARTYQQQQGVQLPDGTLLSEQDVEFLRSMWMQDVAPVYDFTERSQLAETEERATDIISDVAARNEFEFKDEREAKWIRDRADSYVEQAVQNHGVGPRAAEAAIEMAFNEFREIVGAREQARVDQEMNQLRTLGSAPMQPTPTAPAAQNLAAPTGGPRAVVQKYFPGS